MPRFSRVLLVLVVLLWVVGCHVEPRQPIGPGNEVSQVLVAPDTITLEPLETWQFGVFARTALGDSVSVSVDWSASAGSIDQSARYTADTSEDDVIITAQTRPSTPGAIPLAGRAIVHKRRVVQLILQPPAISLLPGATQQFTTLGVRNNGDTAAVQVNYAATGGIITPNGLFTAGSASGTYQVIATRRALADTATVTILNPPVATVSVAPSSAALYIGKTTQLSATLRDASGNIVTGRSVTWSSSASSVASVSANGLVTAQAVGSATITATSEGQSGSASVTVALVPVASVTVTPPSATLRIGTSAQLGATMKDSAGNVLNGRSVTWSSSAAGVATVSSSGMVTAVGAGSATITATSEGKSGTAAITVSAVPVVSVTISPATSNLTVGATVQLSATTKDSAGNTLTGRAVTWSSNATGVATVSASGVVAAVGAGSATITATSEGKSGTASITVTVVPVATVTVAPATKTLRIGTSAQLTATTKDASGNVLSGRTVTWSTDAPSIATVSASGLVTAVAVGSATITATSEGQTGTAAITVTVVPVASVAISPASPSVNIGATQQLTAVTKDSAGNVLTGRIVTWSSSATTIATVSGTGLVSGVAAGSATITATSEGKNGTVSVTVIDPNAVRAGYYAATNGTSGGDGSIGQPWDLRTALAGASGRVHPGDTVWVRGGVYSGAFTSSVAGSSGLPVVIRAYPGERPIIDGAPSTQETFTINGDWSTFWGLEIMNSILTRNARRPQGIYVYLGSHVKIINFIVHDVGEGLYTESSADDVEIYGSVFYNQGWQTTIRSDGHGIYVKNTGPLGKLVRDNVFFNSYGLGIHGYTDAGNGFLRNITIEGNVMFNAGTISTYPSANLLLGGEAPVENGVVKDNYLYFSPGKGSTNARWGYLSVASTVLTATGNYIVGGATPLDIGFFSTATVSGNTLYGSGHVLNFRDDNAAGYTWTGQRYYRDPTASAWAFNGSWSSLNNWETATGLGASDVATSGSPTQPAVFVRPNVYEPGRATVVVYNWSGQSSINVDLSGVVPSGAHYEVRSVQNLFGAPITSGTFGGSITIPLTAVTPIQPIGGSDVAPTITGPAFDVFVVKVVP